jgi:hypothetical protein
MIARISPKGRDFWRSWTRQHSANMVDFVAHENDPVPEFIHVLSEIYLGLRSFPRFLRSTPRASAQTSPLLTKERS